MAQSPTPRPRGRLSLSGVCLLAAGVVGWGLATRSEPAPPAAGPPQAGIPDPHAAGAGGTPDAEARLRALLPTADPPLLRRVARDRGAAAAAAAERHGEDGVWALDLFGAEAAHLLARRPPAFAALLRVMHLDPARFRLAAGPWRRAVLDWAEGGTLPRFLDALRGLPADRLATAEACPPALPLLCTAGCPTAHAVLARHRHRAWRLFLAIDFANHPADAERVALAVDADPDLILRLNDEYGLPFALLLVPPTTPGSERLPEVVRHAVRTADDDEATAVAFAAANHAEMLALLAEGRTADDLTAAVDRFAALPPAVRALAADHPHTLRLLAETWHGQPVGARALERCGPAAGDLVYAHYAGSDRLKRPALVALARLGEPAYRVFDEHRANKSFLAFLRRADPDLLDPPDDPPIAHAIRRVSRDGQEAIAVYARVENLRAQVLADASDPPPAEAVLEWLPGYTAYRTAAAWADGRHVSGEDLVWVAFDLADFVPGGKVVTTPAKVGVRGSKALARKLAKSAARTGVTRAEREALQAAEKELTRAAGKQALELLEREGTDLARRLGDTAGEVAARRVEARTVGLALPLTDRRREYLRLAEAGDASGKARLVERIGEDGAAAYARHAGYDPLLPGRPGRGPGFDQVYRDGDRIKVIEAKGGGSPTRVYRGHEQGTVENARAVAEWTRGSRTATAEEKRVAEQVLMAADEGRLDVEVVRTQHVQGTPGVTRVETVAGPKGSPALAAPLRHPPVGPGGWARPVAAPPATHWLRQGRGVAGRVGLALWHDGVRPLADRVVSRLGVAETVPVQDRPVDDPDRAVGDFAIALMERVL